jgi:hypothetical protein
MIGITRDAIQIGDIVTRDGWQGNGYKVVKVEKTKIWILLNNVDHIMSYDAITGWMLVSRERSEHRRIVL